LQHRLDTRKAVSRAAGILASARNLTHRQALSLLLEQARESRRPLLPLARTVILGQETGHLQPFSLRRLGPNEVTRAVGAHGPELNHDRQGVPASKHASLSI
jgi:hypothetical protein